MDLIARTNNHLRLAALALTAGIELPGLEGVGEFLAHALPTRSVLNSDGLLKYAAVHWEHGRGT
jgi:hypothetical protein